MQVVGVVLVRNEDVFVEQAIRNIAAFCDRIYAVDHLSTDLTPEILRRLASELDHLTTRALERRRRLASRPRALRRDGHLGLRRRRRRALRPRGARSASAPISTVGLTRMSSG